MKDRSVYTFLSAIFFLLLLVVVVACNGETPANIMRRVLPASTSANTPACWSELRMVGTESLRKTR
ncbi:MAG TPA: hypothetical protein PKH77_15260 [Anaerolineae bacterium]|nr:hypothetical protein [Anaerolineae bacterium]